jgi:hypothetical protein
MGYPNEIPGNPEGPAPVKQDRAPDPLNPPQILSNRQMAQRIRRDQQAGQPNPFPDHGAG